MAQKGETMNTAEPVMDAVANVEPTFAFNDVLPLLKMMRVMLGQVGVRWVELRLRKPFCRVTGGIDEILGRNEQWL
jgi:hypothetical protein